MIESMKIDQNTQELLEVSQGIAERALALSELFEATQDLIEHVEYVAPFVMARKVA